MTNKIKTFWGLKQHDFQDLEDAINGFICNYDVKSVEIKKYGVDYNYYMAVVLYDDKNTSSNDTSTSSNDWLKNRIKEEAEFCKNQQHEYQRFSCLSEEQKNCGREYFEGYLKCLDNILDWIEEERGYNNNTTNSYQDWLKDKIKSMMKRFDEKITDIKCSKYDDIRIEIEGIKYCEGGIDALSSLLNFIKKKGK